jgi:CD63 antigen
LLLLTHFFFKQFTCCGLNGAKDWIPVIEGIPVSCCDRTFGAINNVTCELNSTTLHKAGCIDAFGDYIKEHAVSLGGVGIGLAVVQVK